MKILVEPAENLNTIKDYCAFNQISIWENSIWCHDINAYRLSTSTGDLTIINSDIFKELTATDQDIQDLSEFLSTQKMLWVFNDMDGLLFLNINEKTLRLIDSMIGPGQLTWFVDGVVDFDHFSAFKNIKVVQQPINRFVYLMPRIQHANIKKHNCQHNFLITTILRKDRPHRDLLYQYFDQKKLLTQGLSIFNHESQDFAWQGTTAHHHNWQDGHASMDLYLNCWFEVVPETMHQTGLFFLTEKTIKPIVTETPFVILSSPEYLKFLRSLGFKTFNGLIDESYDQEFDLEQRVAKIASTVQDIIRNGAESFYRASADILKHNRQKMYELYGSYHHQTDSIIQRQLNQVTKM